MPDSVWTGTIEAFRARVGGTGPVPAGVAVSAVSASLALALVAKILDITSKRKSFAGDRDRIAALIDHARAESALLTRLADEDVEAFHQFLEATRAGAADAIATACERTIEVPMQGAGAAVRGLELCLEAAASVRGLTTADLGIAAKLLDAGARAMLLSVDFNIRHGGAAADYSAERMRLEAESHRLAESIGSKVTALL